jgi:hypothetical protein
MVQELKRLPDWRARLSAEMDRQRRMGFAWGRHDCALGLACGAVEAITGENLRREFPGYRTAAGALRALQRRGYASLGAAVADHLPEWPHPVRARVGDIGLIAADGEIGEALCVVDVSGLVVLTEEGHGTRPRADMIRAFKVG